MDEKYSNQETFSPSGTCTLKQIFELMAEEMISDEQVERVLEPVRKMIYSGHQP